MTNELCPDCDGADMLCYYHGRKSEALTRGQSSLCQRTGTGRKVRRKPNLSDYDAIGAWPLVGDLLNLWKN